ncbi:MAG: hypothetical protein AAFP19_23415, partial [Bacteroidota bacterium]
MTTQAAPNSGGSKFGKTLIYLVFISIGLVALYYFYQNNYSEFTAVPEEMQITYMPADFDYQVDEENTLAILTNPHR